MYKIGPSIHSVCRHPQNASHCLLELILNSQLTSKTLSPADPKQGDHLPGVGVTFPYKVLPTCAVWATAEDSSLGNQIFTWLNFLKEKKRKEEREIPRGKKFQLYISIFHFIFCVLKCLVRLCLGPAEGRTRGWHFMDPGFKKQWYERRFVLESSLCCAIELLRKLQCVFFPTKRLEHGAPDRNWIQGKWREPDWVRMLAAKPLSLVLGGTGWRLTPVERAQSDVLVWFPPATNKVSFMAHYDWVSCLRSCSLDKS